MMDDNIVRTIAALEKNGFETNCFETGDEAIEQLLKEINIKESVGIGGSMTIINMEVKEKLRNLGYTVYTHNGESDPLIKKEMLKKAMTTEVYLTSSNAVTEDGKLINIDGNGNRLSSMIYGHERVYYICGKNKLTKDYSEAMNRIKTVACKRNSERLNLNTPCRYGECNDCSSKQRICNATLIMEKRMTTGRAIIYIINEELGY
ncbi:MAG: lactate utilization protein [Peptostreptococcaceae bacterium]|nr:lactate utilization protein [Peptostreptococcaceae bacterium]